MLFQHISILSFHNQETRQTVAGRNQKSHQKIISQTDAVTLKILYITNSLSPSLSFSPIMKYRLVQKFGHHPSISTSNQSTAANSLWSDLWFVFHLPAFLNLILSSTWCFWRRGFRAFVISRMSPLMQKRSVIQYFVLCQKSNQQIAAKLAKGYGQDALCLRAV
jgi:hypothetical protein